MYRPARDDLSAAATIERDGGCREVHAARHGSWIGLVARGVRQRYREARSGVSALIARGAAWQINAILGRIDAHLYRTAGRGGDAARRAQRRHELLFKRGRIDIGATAQARQNDQRQGADQRSEE